MKITYRLPSKKTQYGYAEVEFEADSNFYDLGTAYHRAVETFQAGESSSTPEQTENIDKLLSEELDAKKISEHVHKFRYGDDDNGHSGSFCECGEEEPDKAPWNKPALKAGTKPWETKAATQVDLFG